MNTDWSYFFDNSSMGYDSCCFSSSYSWFRSFNGYLGILGYSVNETGADPSGYLGRLGVSDIVVKSVGSLFAIVMVRFLSVAIGFWQGLTWWRPLSIGLSAFYH